MTKLLHRLSAALFAACAFIVAPVAEIAHAAESAVQAPKNAFNKPERHQELAARARDNGEVRVILGLQTAQEFARGPDHDPDQVKEQAVSARQQRVLQRVAGYNMRNVKRFRWHHFIAVTTDATALAALLADPEVTSVSEDRPLYPVLFDTPGITRADKAWAAGFRGGGQTVAIIDTGVDKTHPFFTGKVVAEACFSHPGAGGTTYCPSGQGQQIGPGAGVNCPDYGLGCWHGTHVAGIAAGNYGVLSATTGGIAPDASVIAIQAFQRQCSGTSCSIVAFESDLMQALEHVYSLRNTYAIASANMSVGGGNYTAACDAESPAMTSVIQSLRAAKIATVIAAGNTGLSNAISFPGCISRAISVGSTTKQNQISSFSNSASFLSLLAPGSGVTSSVPGGGFGGASGTSMATPHVAGAWAILKQAKPTATVDEVLAALQNGGLPITDSRNGVTKSLIQIGYDATTPGALGILTGISNISPTVTLTSPADGQTLAAPASITVAANAADADGGIAKVEFFRDSFKIGEVQAPGPYTMTFNNVTPGAYVFTARATDTQGASVNSGSAMVTVSGSPAASVNAALAFNGGAATASSQYTAAPYNSNSFPPASAINGDRRGVNWDTGGFWHDATGNVFPDWLQINFSGVRSIGEIDVFTVQDNYTAPVEPTTTMTFTQYGISAFQVQYWTGSAWTDVPGGNVTVNNLVWRKFTFSPINTDRIRILVNAGLSSHSRIAEVEAWTAAAGGNALPTVSLTSPANNTSLPAPATVNLSANAADADGTISKVEFYRDTTLIQTVTSPTSGTPSSGTWTYSDTNVGAGSYSYTAKAYDNLNAVTTSTPATRVNVTAPSGSVNVALQANGGVATASSQYATAPYNQNSFPPTGANNGDRKGTPWDQGGMWHDGTYNSFLDWLQINFNAVQSIGEIDVFTVQDNYTAPVDPTPTLTFTQYGITTFQVQYWTGSTWVDVPGGNVTGNNLVWRKFTFTPITTNAIRVLVNAGLNGHSRIVEVEAWAAVAGGNAPPTVSMTSPANNTTLTVPATVNLSANAADADGTISKVGFYRDTTLIQTVTSPSSGTVSSGTWTYSDTNVGAGSYSYTAKAYDNLNAVTTSTPATIVNVTAPSGSVNVARQANGGVATASSQYATAPYNQNSFPPTGANNGDRKGTPWDQGGMWHDGNYNSFPDWLQINFNGTYSIGEIDVFTPQDNYTAPVDPTPTLTFTQYGITAFQVQYWTGSAWADVPGGNVTGNNLVWRKFTFSPISTDRIRVLVNAGLNGHSRVVEVEAWTTTAQTTN